MIASKSPFRYFNSSPQIIRLVVMMYARTGHGGNQELKNSKPDDFRFSILQITSHDLEAAEVIALEASWKERLHTREFGLNLN